VIEDIMRTLLACPLILKALSLPHCQTHAGSSEKFRNTAEEALTLYRPAFSARQGFGLPELSQKAFVGSIDSHIPPGCRSIQERTPPSPSLPTWMVTTGHGSSGPYE